MGVIWCVHGFLGLPSDWDFLPFPHRSVDLFRGEEIDAGPDDSLIAYSMGGRLALQFLMKHRIAKAVIVSAGIDKADSSRLAVDENWARRFESDEWLPLIRSWNAQSVLGQHHIDRDENDFDRSKLARALREWSPAVLPAPRLEEIETPVLWVAGERDWKYVEIGERAVARMPSAQLWICRGAGHRVPWEQPEEFSQELREFLQLQ
jgi:2-succinyl-6-hydroxy-2,4-cyclohexadiene-1-carboxylate synthase